MHPSPKYVVITRPDFWQGEAEAITLLFEAGLQRLHLRKPDAHAKDIESLLAAIPTCYHARIVVGKMTTATTCSCHSIAELAQKKTNSAYEYLTLSPIYDSISKQGYAAAFSHAELQAAHEAGIIDERVLAMGGITRENISQVMQYGFGGVAVLGDAWQTQTLPIVLSIAGSDPSAGAGIQQESQLRALFAGQRVDAVRIGFIPNIDAARAIVHVLREEKRRCILPVVYDPMMISTSGHPRMDNACVRYIQEELFPLCTLITINQAESEMLGWYSPSGNWGHIAPEHNVLLRANHADSNLIINRLWLANEKRELAFTSPRINTHSPHSTGCTLSSAIASSLAHKHSLSAAVGYAKDYIARTIVAP